jgi:hypothetical protein
MEIPTNPLIRSTDPSTQLRETGIAPKSEASRRWCLILHVPRVCEKRVRTEGWRLHA